MNSSNENAIQYDTSSLEEFYNISHICTDKKEQRFAKIIGAIEDILISEKFLNKQNDFLEEFWQEFEDTEENKLIYTDIYAKYIQTVEKYFEYELAQRITDFEMKEFINDLKKRENDLDSEVFEMLSTFFDFLAFKSMFLEYRKMKEGRLVDFSPDFKVSQLELK